MALPPFFGQGTTSRSCRCQPAIASRASRLPFLSGAVLFRGLSSLPSLRWLCSSESPQKPLVAVAALTSSIRCHLRRCPCASPSRDLRLIAAAAADFRSGADFRSSTALEPALA
ncbi:hypothetical protein P7K49_034966 [Saguinus oedipus]|uniref:Uncharacterized protein n=1 Tax=Saguinus oedipus TaxID=9490 RepID=A0ABQ9TWA4_SAGOE|nr:hypothetical protein P7K49_034966 [Saguinus oedipus]